MLIINFSHQYPENKIIRDISKDREVDLSSKGNITVRVGIASILENANAQMVHGLQANFGIRDLGLPHVFSSDIDVSDVEMLSSTLGKARTEMSRGAEAVPTNTLKCIAKTKRANGNTFIRCREQAVRGCQFCPLHLQVCDLIFL